MGFGLAGEVFVDSDFGQVGPEHVGARLQHDGDQRNDHLPSIRMQIGEKALHQARIVRLPEYLFVVDSSHEPLT